MSFGEINNKVSGNKIKKIIRLPPLILPKYNDSNIASKNSLAQQIEFTTEEKMSIVGRMGKTIDKKRVEK
jgi:hypothetical protein